MLLNTLDRVASSSGPRWTYGPNRPFFSVISAPVSGSVPSTRSSDGASSSSRAFSTVSSSGGRSSGRLARWSPSCDVRPVAPDADDRARALGTSAA